MADAEGAAQLLGHVDQARGCSGVLGGDPVDRRRGQRDEGKAIAAGEEEQAGDDGNVRGGRGQLAGQQEADDSEADADQHQHLAVHSVDQDATGGL